MHVDNWNPDTYLWILEDCDVPYIIDEWNNLLQRYGKDPENITGMTIIGRYLSKMQLKQNRNYRWKDTEYLQEVHHNKIEQYMRAQGKDTVEIEQVLSEHSLPELHEGKAPEFVPPAPERPMQEIAEPDYFDDGTESSLVADLTEEDRTYLRLKWGRTYKPEEWVKLEQLYQEMRQSYDIQGAGHEDVLKLVCKTSLKANQLLDLGDVESAQKMVKMYDSLMKSGKFTAAQNKDENGEYVNSISELVEICEKEGFIPRFYIDSPNDKVDEVLFDLKKYTNSLVTEEMNLGNLIEGAVKEMARLEAQEEDEDNEEEELMYDDLNVADADYEEFNEFLDSENSLSVLGE